MEPLLTERFSINSHNVPSAQSTSDRGEVVSDLRWERKSSCEDLMRGDTYQNKKQLARQLLEAGACQEQLVQPGESIEQNGLEENIVLQQKTHGEDHPFQGGDLLVQKDRLEPNCWKLDFESEPDNEEIYWGCFYFFPWLRMCKRDKKEQP